MATLRSRIGEQGREVTMEGESKRWEDVWKERRAKSHLTARANISLV
jgi:hypothetical protein